MTPLYCPACGVQVEGLERHPARVQPCGHKVGVREVDGEWVLDSFEPPQFALAGLTSLWMSTTPGDLLGDAPDGTPVTGNEEGVERMTDLSHFLYRSTDTPERP